MRVLTHHRTQCRVAPGHLGATWCGPCGNVPLSLLTEPAHSKPRCDFLLSWGLSFAASFSVLSLSFNLKIFRISASFTLVKFLLASFYADLHLDYGLRVFANKALFPKSACQKRLRCLSKASQNRRRLKRTPSIFHPRHVSRFTLFWHDFTLFGTILVQLLRPARPGCRGVTAVKKLDMAISIRSCNFHTITISVYTIAISRVKGGSCIQRLKSAS